MDRILLMLLGGLALTVGLFVAGVFAYPFGVLILIALIIARLLQLQGWKRR